MDKNRIIALKSSFDGISNSVAEAHIEFWYARDLMGLLGYTRWENFAEAIMINLPKGAKRSIRDGARVWGELISRSTGSCKRVNPLREKGLPYWGQGVNPPDEKG